MRIFSTIIFFGWYLFSSIVYSAYALDGLSGARSNRDCHFFIKQLNSKIHFTTQAEALQFYLQYFQKRQKAIFQVVKKLGQGDQGVVYHLTSGAQNFALKFKVNPTPQEMASIQHEYAMLNSLHHPNVVKVFGHHERGAILMEFIPGHHFAVLLGELVSAQRQQSPHVEQLLDRIAQVKEQLQHIVRDLRSLGIEHQDLAPENIIITPEGNVIIIDFGNAIYK